MQSGGGGPYDGAALRAPPRRCGPVLWRTPALVAFPVLALRHVHCPASNILPTGFHTLDSQILASGDESAMNPSPAYSPNIGEGVFSEVRAGLREVAPW
jgi:hypothetical protein